MILHQGSVGCKHNLKNCHRCMFYVIASHAGVKIEAVTYSKVAQEVALLRGQDAWDMKDVGSVVLKWGKLRMSLRLRNS